MGKYHSIETGLELCAVLSQIKEKDNEAHILREVLLVNAISTASDQRSYQPNWGWEYFPING